MAACVAGRTDELARHSAPYPDAECREVIRQAFEAPDEIRFADAAIRWIHRRLKSRATGPVQGVDTMEALDLARKRREERDRPLMEAKAIINTAMASEIEFARTMVIESITHEHEPCDREEMRRFYNSLPAVHPQFAQRIASIIVKGRQKKETASSAKSDAVSVVSTRGQ